VNRALTTRLGRTLTLSLCLSKLLLTHLFSVLFLEQPQLPKRRTTAQSFGNPRLLSEQSQDFEVRGQTRILWCQVVEGGRELVHDSRSMKPRIRNANLPITHVLDLCVKLLGVLHISRTQGWSVEGFCSAWRLLPLYNSPSGATYTNLWTCRWRVVRWYVCDVLVPCMHHYGAFCPGSRLGRQPATRSKPLPQITTHHSRGRAPGREEKDTLLAGY